MRLPETTARLDSEERLAVFDGALLKAENDEVLRGVLEEAARRTGYPTALVSLVTKRVQYFRGYVGLGQGLTVTQSTDRCVSFCQYVVESDAPMEVEDALMVAGLPQKLPTVLGIRAYKGVPLHLHGQCVGSLCLLDVVPRPKDAAVLAVLEELRGRVEARLAALAAEPPLGPSELRDKRHQRTRLLLAEGGAIARLNADLAAGKLTRAEFGRTIDCLSVLSGAVRASV